MKKFFKKNYLIIPAAVILIFLGSVFNSQHANFNSIASILNAQQILNTNYSSLNYSQKVNLISQIDKELTSLGFELKGLNSELLVLKKEKESEQSEYNVANQKVISINSQIASQTARIDSLRNRIETLNENYREKNKQCNQLKGVAVQNCRNQLKTISGNISDTRNQIAETQGNINNLRISLSSAQQELSLKNTELRIAAEKVTSKQEEINEIQQMISRLSRFRVDVVNSTSNQNNQNNPKPGCTDINATNWDSSATEDDGSCQYKGDAKGCTDSAASNYDPEATEDDGSCRYETVCECAPEIDPSTGGEKEAEKVTKVRVNITAFGGPDDNVVTASETGSVSGESLRSLDPNDLYTAWPMPGLNEDNPNSPLDLPNIEKCFGPETESWKGERNARANEALDERYAKISYTDANGNIKTVLARIVDRGPKITTRWDASKGLWNALGLTDKLNNPNDPNNMVDLEISLVPKDGGSCGSSS